MSKLKLNEDQAEAMTSLKRFVDHPTVNTFVLKGYAGTGKTFLMQQFGKWLQEKKLPFVMLASTGRAATVLRGKTGFVTSTVHGELYRFSKVDGDDDSIGEDEPAEKFGQMVIRFSVRPPDEEDKKIYIVDESSMLSSEYSDSDATSFGSGVLLADFFHATGRNKVVFVGDPGQLPPIGQVFSPALDMGWLMAERRLPIEWTLTKIERQSDDCDILVLAANIRTYLNTRLSERWPKFPCRYLNSVTIVENDEALLNLYFDHSKTLGVNGALGVCQSNKQVALINSVFRKRRFGSIEDPQVSDVLLVIQNNQRVPLTNGDFVEVAEVGRVDLQDGLHFMPMKVKACASGDEFEVLAPLEVLYSDMGQLTKDERRSLMIGFSRRMKKKKLKVNSDEYLNAMKTDPYLNCLQVKFGYAVTCHKAQGGEWDEIFLFLAKGMYAMERPALYAWWYTAVTRAKSKLFVADGWWLC